MIRTTITSGLAMLALCTAGLAEEAAAPATAPAAAATAVTEPAPAATEVTAPPTAVPAAGTATIIFFRPSKFVGGAIGFIVREGTTELGKLRNGRYFSVEVAPGKHEYVVHSETKDVLTMEVDAGETYYVQGTLGFGIMAGRPNLAPSDAATFEAIKGKLKLAVPLKKGEIEDDSK